MFKKLSFLTLLMGSLLLAGCSADRMSDGSMEKMEKDGDAMMMEKAEIPEVVKIGYIGPLTGNAAAYGQDVKGGIALYFEQNPTIDGKSVEVIYEDGKCNGQDAANAAQKLINVDKVQVILGGQCSGETLAAAPIAEQNKVVLLSALSSNPDITTAGDYIFRNYPSDDSVAKTMVDVVFEAHEKVAMISEQTDYAQGYRGAVNKHAEAAGKTDSMVVDEAFAVDNSDFRTLLTKAKEGGADALIVIAQSPTVAGFAVKQSRELGLDVDIYGTDAMPGTDFFDIAKDAAEGVKAVYVSEDPSRSGYADFKGQIGEVQAAEVFPAFGYDSAQLVAEAIAKVGYGADNIKEHFYNMETFKGVASDVTFDENGDNNVASSVRIAKDGKFVPFTE